MPSGSRLTSTTCPRFLLSELMTGRPLRAINRGILWARLPTMVWHELESEPLFCCRHWPTLPASPQSVLISFRHPSATRSTLRLSSRVTRISADRHPRLNWSSLAIMHSARRPRPEDAPSQNSAMSSSQASMTVSTARATLSRNGDWDCSPAGLLGAALLPGTEAPGSFGAASWLDTVSGTSTSAAAMRTALFIAYLRFQPYRESNFTRAGTAARES